uniref:Uncharacterized protein n=1 Tax=Acrobeloides nanus TaxID=290746 RepID=A0A914CVY0_9BILA
MNAFCMLLYASVYFLWLPIMALIKHYCLLDMLRICRRIAIRWRALIVSHLTARACDNSHGEAVQSKA